MTRVIVDPTLREKLHDLQQPLELCDEGGRVLARVTPVPPAAGDRVVPQISDEELRRREQSDDWLTTAELLSDLEER